MVQDDQGMTALALACQFSLSWAVSTLLSIGGSDDIEVTDRAGWKPLHHCAVNDSAESGMRALD